MFYLKKLFLVLALSFGTSSFSKTDLVTPVDITLSQKVIKALSHLRPEDRDLSKPENLEVFEHYLLETLSGEEIIAYRIKKRDGTIQQVKEVTNPKESYLSAKKGSFRTGFRCFRASYSACVLRKKNCCLDTSEDQFLSRCRKVSCTGGAIGPDYPVPQ